MNSCDVIRIDGETFEAWNHAEGAFFPLRGWMLQCPDYFIPSVLRTRLLQFLRPE